MGEPGLTNAEIPPRGFAIAPQKVTAKVTPDWELHIFRTSRWIREIKLMKQAQRFS